MSRDYPDLEILGIAGFDSADAHEAFVDGHELGHLRHAIDDDGSLFGHFGSRTQDAWFFIDEAGQLIAETRYGEMSEASLRDLLDDLDAA